jgi:hypothetical protein
MFNPLEQHFPFTPQRSGHIFNVESDNLWRISEKLIPASRQFKGESITSGIAEAHHPRKDETIRGGSQKKCYPPHLDEKRLSIYQIPVESIQKTFSLDARDQNTSVDFAFDHAQPSLGISFCFEGFFVGLDSPWDG